MDPVSKHDLDALRAQTKLEEKNGFIADRVKEIYEYVTSQAMNSDTNHSQWCFDGFSYLAEFPSTNDELVAQLQSLFPESSIEYGIFKDSGNGDPPHYIRVDWRTKSA